MRSLLLAVWVVPLLVVYGCEESANSSGSGGGGQGGTEGAPPLGGHGGVVDASGGTAGVPTESYPPHLSASGLYLADMTTLAAGVRAFQPRFPLWSDSATKRRWIQWPEGSQIDTSDPDYWQFPVGTKLWKEFTRDGVRVETRLLQKRRNGSWWRIAYRWNEEQTEAEPVPDGEENASGTPHDIPSQEECASCHGRTRGEVLGFSAIQLAYDSEGLDLQDLLDEDALTHPIAPALTLPGGEEEIAALGSLHANCGTCHNPTSSVQARVDLDLRLRVGLLGSVEETPTYLTTVGVEIDLTDGSEVPGATLRIDPGSPGTSAVFLRLDSRGEVYSMPPLGTEEIAEEERDWVGSWIGSL